MTVAAGPFIGYGSDLQDSATVGGAYTTVGSIVDIDTPDYTADGVDVSYVQMATPVAQAIPKIIKPGTCKFTLIYKETTYAHIFGLVRTPYFFNVILPDTGGTKGTIIAFPGWYMKAPIKIHLEDMVVCEVEIFVSGAVTVTAGS